MSLALASFQNFQQASSANHGELPVEKLLEYLQSNSITERNVAHFELRNRHNDLVDALTKIVSSDEANDDSRSSAMTLLTELNSDAAIPAICNLIDDPPGDLFRFPQRFRMPTAVVSEFGSAAISDLVTKIENCGNDGIREQCTMSVVVIFRSKTRAIDYLQAKSKKENDSAAENLNKAIQWIEDNLSDDEEYFF